MAPVYRFLETEFESCVALTTHAIHVKERHVNMHRFVKHVAYIPGTYVYDSISARFDVVITVLMKSQVVWRVTTYAAVNGSDVGFGEV
jgi:hypothetical protein